MVSKLWRFSLLGLVVVIGIGCPVFEKKEDAVKEGNILQSDTHVKDVEGGEDSTDAE